MTKKQLPIITLILAAGLLLSACAGPRGSSTSWPGVMVDEDLAYVAHNQYVYAVQLTNGAERSRYPDEPINSTTFYTSPASLGEDRYLVGSYKNSIYRLDAASGNFTEFFKAPQTFWIAPPLVTDLGIFAPSSNDTLYALDSGGGEQWSYETGEPMWATPTLDGETLFVTSMDHYLYALDAKDGDLLWRTDLGGTSIGTPALDKDGTLYIGTFENQALAIDSQTGKVLWRFDTQNWVWGSLTVYNGTVFITDLSGTIYAVETATQDLLWMYSADGEISGSVAVAGENLYAYTKNGEVMALNAEDGSVRWTRTIEKTELGGGPVITDELILISVINNPKLLIAYDFNGSLVWEFEPKN